MNWTRDPNLAVSAPFWLSYDYTLTPNSAISLVFKPLARDSMIAAAKQKSTPQGSKMIYEAIKQAGITSVATLPEQKLEALIALAGNDDSIRHIELCREEEGVAICSGIYLAGGKPAMIIQNGGLLNSVNGLTNTALHFQIPILLLVYYAGDFGDRGFASVGGVTEQVLEAMGIRYRVLRKHEDIDECIGGAWALAEDSQRPVAVLLTKSVLLQ